MTSILKWLFQSEDTEDLRDSLAEMEKRVRRLEEDWTEVYHKFRVLQMRVAKQVQRLDQAPEGETTQPAGGETGAVPTEHQSGLTPTQAAINQRILARRHRVPNGG